MPLASDPLPRDTMNLLAAVTSGRRARNPHARRDWMRVSQRLACGLTPRQVATAERTDEAADRRAAGAGRLPRAGRILRGLPGPAAGRRHGPAGQARPPRPGERALATTTSAPPCSSCARTSCTATPPRPWPRASSPPAAASPAPQRPRPRRHPPRRHPHPPLRARPPPARPRRRPPPPRRDRGARRPQGRRRRAGPCGAEATVAAARKALAAKTTAPASPAQPPRPPAPLRHGPRRRRPRTVPSPTPVRPGPASPPSTTVTGASRRRFPWTWNGAAPIISEPCQRGDSR